MNFDKATTETLVAYFVIAAGIVFALWKSLPPFLTYWDSRKKNKGELIKIHNSETAEAIKARLEHEFKLEELADKRIQAILDYQQEQIDDLKADVELRDDRIKIYKDAEEARKPIYMRKLFLLRESQRELQMLEADVLKQPKSVFRSQTLVKITALKKQVEDHEKLLI
jgi:hypothetical protein